MGVGRFAPSITGSAHPGTLLAGLLAWLDARSRNDRFILRLEDLDKTRLRPGQQELMVEAMQWLGLEWDQLVVQSTCSDQHEEALDLLAETGRLYPCHCTRKMIRENSQPSPDGGYVYNNRCRGRAFPSGGWRETTDAIRVNLPDLQINVVDESGADLGQNPAMMLGDPVVVRRDGACAYHLVVVVDDGKSLVTRVVRGHDLAMSTATQVSLQQLLRLPRPSYRHHLLLLENHGEKLAKLHGSMPYEQLAAQYTGDEMCGLLAKACGLRTTYGPCTPSSLLADFDWDRVGIEDRLYEPLALMK